MDLSQLRWRKSSRSVDSEHAECVEIALISAGVLVRDSKNPTGPTLVLPASAWRSLRTR
ncbi:DUF397 domain-containing protein [Actinokineospora sp.]|uniref:DUF397 domain-containing protein n=1 Tax=Actinokineospora sp. TaxID=1872133 RepID=UPI003D6BB341